MSSCLSGGATYTLKTMKSPPSRAASTHNTPSPSSTISESNSPPFTISTRRPRTRRKRPNQTYNEAAALLSTAYPNIFSSMRNTLSPGTKSPLSDYDEASQLLLPFETIDEVFNPAIQTEPYQFLEKREFSFNSEVTRFELLDDFDAESIILDDEEIEEGIDSFMGSNESNDGECTTMPWYRSSIGFSSPGNFPLGLGLRSSLREEDDDDDGSLCRYPTVELKHISPRIQTTTTAAALTDDVAVDSIKSKKKKTKKKKKVAAAAAESRSVEDLTTEKRVSTFLKLDYDRVLEAWSDKESPFSDEILGSHATGIDIHTMLAEIDLFGESGMREASVLRYKEKRMNRLFSNSKQIRYQVRKLSADQRPRMKGRFVRRPNVRSLSGL
ncbi:protein CHLOROPLAST IMPORT APPARATUS 2 [Brassica rapa]|uniref:CCT domain-containing protein n=1 Tax=Brassica campestris TaxID=3711 RepID=M4DRJ1_BRACM|nr:protein CHLOROPLAST IMPORT APPARATUS 2 [Brassica rapa]